jgi:hypothetical protein
MHHCLAATEGQFLKESVPQKRCHMSSCSHASPVWGSMACSNQWALFFCRNLKTTPPFLLRASPHSCQLNSKWPFWRVLKLEFY